MCPIELARIIHRGFGFPYRRRSTRRSTWRGGREVRGASLTGRRECIEDSYSGVMCAVCGRSPAAVPGAGPARRLQPFHSCVLASRTLPQAQNARNHGTIGISISPDRPHPRRTAIADIENNLDHRWKWSYLTKTCAVCCRLLSIVVAGGALCKKRLERHRAVCFAAVPVALPALPAFLVLLLGAVLLLLLLPSLAL